METMDIRTSISGLALLALSCGGDTASREVRVKVAQTMIITQESVYPILRQAYITEGLSCIERADTPAQAQTCVDVVQDQWDPIWTAWDVAAEALEAWSAIVYTNAGSAEILSAASAGRKGYCSFREVALEKVELPPWPGGCQGYVVALPGEPSQ